MNRVPSTRGVAVVALLVAGASGLLAATQPWASIALVDGRSLELAGQALAGGVTILSLACVALALVLPITGPVWRYALGALALLLGALLAAHVLASRAGLGAAVDALVAEATGLAGTAQAEEIAVMTEAPWPLLGVAAGIVAAAAGILVIASARRWPARARQAARYERSGSGLAWDVMDDGEDPTR